MPKGQRTRFRPSFVKALTVSNEYYVIGYPSTEWLAAGLRPGETAEFGGAPYLLRSGPPLVSSMRSLDSAGSTSC